MAIVKMSQFELLVMNERVDDLLKSLQSFENIVFANNQQEIEGMKPYESIYDFKANEKKRHHIQTILKELSVLKKKEKKSKPFNMELGLQSMTLNEIDKIVSETDLDSILSFYAEDYEGDEQRIGSFRIIASQNPSSFDNEILKSLIDARPIIGQVDSDKIDKLIKELQNIQNSIIMYQPFLKDTQSMICIITTSEYRQTCEILAEKYDIEMRSAVSLHIEDKIKGLKSILRNILEKHETYHNRLSNIGFYQEILMAHYESLSNEALREQTKSNFQSTKYITLIKGWVMTEDADKFENVLKSVCNDMFELDIAPAPLHSPDVPIKLRNNRFASAFEIITNMYSQPRYNEPDPTPIFAPFYAFFFGMMLADLGYGLIMGVAMFLALRLINLKPGIEKIVRMLMYVSIPTIFWGFIYGSFFGGMIPMKPIIDINKDFNTVLIMALAMGIVHLFVALGVRAYIYIRDYKIRYVIYDVVFWYLLLIGAIMLVSQMFTPILTPYNFIAYPFVLIGMLGIVLTNGRDSKTLFGKLALGLYSLYGVTNYVGDIVSYSRLMALGLAGASIGVAFNMMIEMVSGMGILSVIMGTIIFLIGHTFNLLISGLSSYVHAARLTYVEFFGKFFAGGGKAFNPFVANPTFIKIEKE